MKYYGIIYNNLFTPLQADSFHPPEDTNQEKVTPGFSLTFD